MRKMRLLLALAVTAVAASALAAATVARGDGPWTYVPGLDVWVEQSDLPAFEEAQPDLTHSGGSGLVAETPDGPPPEPYGPSIQRVDNKSLTGILYPCHTGGFCPTTVYTVGDGNIETTVWAGSSRSWTSADHTGVLVKTTGAWDADDELIPEEFEPAEPHGTLTLTGFTQTNLSFVADDGWTGTFRISDGAIELRKPR